MATRRNVPVEKTIAQAQGGPSPGSQSSDIRPAVPTGVIYKLLAFTFAMVVLPIGSYFFTVDLVFRGNSMYAGGFAAIMANVVLIGYVIVAVNEDQGDTAEAQKIQDTTQAIKKAQ